MCGKFYFWIIEMKPSVTINPTYRIRAVVVNKKYAVVYFYCITDNKVTIYLIEVLCEIQF